MRNEVKSLLAWGLVIILITGAIFGALWAANSWTSLGVGEAMFIVDKSNGTISEPILGPAAGFLLDGFPRTKSQAKALGKIADTNVVFDLHASEKAIIQRLSGRRICMKCRAIYHIKNMPPKRKGFCDKCKVKLAHRADDKPKAIKKRLKVYKRKTEPLIKYYIKRKLLKRINAKGNPQDIFKNCLKALGE